MANQPVLDKAKTAFEDCRDVIAAGECPGYSRKIDFDDDPATIEQSVINDAGRPDRKWSGKELPSEKLDTHAPDKQGGVVFQLITSLLRHRVSCFKPLHLMLVLGLVLLSGCTHYVMTLNSGAEVDTYGKPKFQDGAYHYKNARGEASVISAGRVKSVQPASMAREDKKALEPPKPRKKRHWYYLWLASNPSLKAIEPPQQA